MISVVHLFSKTTYTNPLNTRALYLSVDILVEEFPELLCTTFKDPNEYLNCAYTFMKLKYMSNIYLSHSELHCTKKYVNCCRITEKTEQRHTIGYEKVMSIFGKLAGLFLYFVCISLFFIL